MNENTAFKSNKYKHKAGHGPDGRSSTYTKPDTVLLEKMNTAPDTALPIQ
jgi:hypothetical protein